MEVKVFLKKLIGLALLSSLTLQCSNFEMTSASSPTSQAGNTVDRGCSLPSIQITETNIQSFAWSEDSTSIIYNFEEEQILYNTLSGQKNKINQNNLLTPTLNPAWVGIENFEEIFISPDQDRILFSRVNLNGNDLYYKKFGEDTEKHLGVFQGNIDKIDWFGKENKAVVAIDWQSPQPVSVFVYIVDFDEGKLVAEIRKTVDYSDVKYLGLTPDERNILFVSYNAKTNLDRTIKLWSISQKEIISTPVFNPLDYRWISNDVFIAVGYQNIDKFPLASIFLYDFKEEKITFLSKDNLNIAPYSSSVKISPNGMSLAFIDNDTGNLYWLPCFY